MFDMLLFGMVGLLLVVLLVFLILVVRDHLKSRSFDLHTSFPQEEGTDQEVVTFEKPKHPSERMAAPREGSEATLSSHEPATTSTPPSASEQEVQTVRDKQYGTYDHSRLTREIGLSSAEADEFVMELIAQIEQDIPRLDTLIEKRDFAMAERVTHGLKGASLNIGENGIAQLLVDYNTYLKANHDPLVVEAYQQRLKEMLGELKEEYSRV